MLIKIVEALAPFSVLENKKFFLFITNGLIPRSAKLLSIGILPSFKYVVSSFFMLSEYKTALPVIELGG